MITRRFAVLVTALTLVLGITGVESARAEAPGHALIFATPNTAIITDPDDPRLDTRLVAFGREVTGIIRDGGAVPGGSTLLDGVFWSSGLQATTYERSREFEVSRTSTDGLHHTADLIRKQYHQESVLTFEYLPRTSPRATAIEVKVPGIDVRDLHDGLVANPTARKRLGGGSVTLDGDLVLIADRADATLVREFVIHLGGRWSSAGVRYGARDFVG